MEALLPDPLTRFIAQATLVIALSRVVGLGARRMGQPMVIAEIIAGILLGPSLLGWLSPEISAVLFEKSSLGILQIVSQIGLILFMFLVGLELDPALLRGRGHTSVVISHTSIIVPFAMGAGLAVYIYPSYSSSTVSLLAFSLFMGAAMSITAFPVLARILSERRLLRTRVGAVTITCAAVDDITAWCILAFVVAAAKSTGVTSAITTPAFAIGYVAAMLFLVRPMLVRVAARIADREGMSQNIVALILLLMFLSSWATDLIGIHALFGAFLFGAILPKTSGFARVLAEKIEDLVLVVLLPLFFAFSGLRTEIGLLDTAETWLVCGVIIAVACAGKFGGSMLAARFTGLSWRESGALGVLMNTRGLMELIVLNIGLDLGVISPTIFSMMVLMALFTTFMTTPLLQWIYPTELMTKDLIAAEPPPSPATPEQLGILLCVSHERAGPGLLSMARALLGPASGDKRGQLLALHLVKPSDRGSFRMAGGEAGGAALTPVVARAAALHLDVRPISFVSADPARDICNVAEVRDSDLVLLGWHKPVLSQTLLGGVVHEVMRDARATVGVFVDRGLGDVRRVLVPFQGSPHDRAALALARRMRHSAGAEITILHVVRPGRAGTNSELGARAAVSTVFDDPASAGVTLEVIEHRAPAEAAIERSKQGFDLVIVGVGREWGLEGRMFGIQPERLLRDCPTSLLVVRDRPADESSNALAEARVSDT
jgi:Kef-type K+ transport system membrane component KefB/nucleotide-binding universal stress UspA family protein